MAAAHEVFNGGHGPPRAAGAGSLEPALFFLPQRAVDICSCLSLFFKISVSDTAQTRHFLKLTCFVMAIRWSLAIVAIFIL